MPIPKIIHQLWKSEDLPARYQALAASWRQRHPNWEYCLWTDKTIRTFVAGHFPDFLATFDGYKDNICRADTGRYMILSHFGGLYADLDTECLQPFDEFIAKREFIIGLEPPEHFDEELFRGNTPEDLLCPTIIASAPAHPYWESVMQCLTTAPATAHVLVRTGPLLLNRARKLYKGAPLTILPAPVFYPFSKREIWSGAAFDIATWESMTRDALAIHYWDGSWFRDGDDDLAPLPESFPLERRPGTSPGASASRPLVNHTPPLISCLMVTRNRYHLSRHALTAFLAQTYSNSELIIIDDGDCTKLADEVARLNDPRLRFIKPATHNASLGRLRNLAVDEARGNYVCQWDDDDLSDPHRLQIQLAAIFVTEARASFLKRWLIWMPLQKRATISTERVWEGSMLCEKAIMPRYPELARGEDTPVMEKICAEHATAHLDIPRLYVYVAHGANTWNDEHFEHHWRATGQRYSGARYEAVVDELNKHLPLRAYEKTLAEQSAPRPDDIPGVNLFGSFGAGTGLGTAARTLDNALGATRRVTIDLDQLRHHTSLNWATHAPHPINIFYTNPDLLTHRLWQSETADSDTRMFAGRTNIGYWNWESDAGLPEGWSEWANRFDEIWVPTLYAVHCIAPHVSVPVLDMPALKPFAAPATDRATLGLPGTSYLFLCVFDELSGFERKNPLGMIDAYCRAFPDDDGKTGLIIKVRSLSPEKRELIDAAIGTRTSISLRLGDVTGDEVASLIANCDALLCLHRSEGFGLVIAEAMQAGKPVVATAWSGNLDFMTPETSYGVKFKTYRLDATLAPYPEGTEWAEPDLDHATALMRALVADPDAGRATGARARTHINALYAPEHTAKRITNRLRHLADQSATTTPRHTQKSSHSKSSQPPVLILTPMKDATRFLPRYFELLDRLDYDKSALSLGIIEGDSADATHALADAALRVRQSDYRRTRLIKQDLGLHLTGARWERDMQKIRRATLARARNFLLATTLDDEAWVLWLDADLIDYPPDLLTRLLAADKDIIVPRCVLPDGRDYDLNSFRFDPARGPAEHPRHMLDGLHQPPRGFGRAYLGDLPASTGPQPIDGVGGTALLVRADLHRSGLNFPAFSHRGYIETEGLAMMAKDMGHTCWALPQLIITHVDG
ncbi:MAG: glycosyltransferase [Parvibaculum sp.]|nr:glycosyltransferase [Parvibaculum sp.]